MQVFATFVHPSYRLVNPGESSPRESAPSQSGASTSFRKATGKSPEPLSVAVVDDDESVRLFIKTILDQTREFACAGCYPSGESALSGVPGSGARVVIMDIRLPGMSGIECTRRLKAMLPGLFIVFVSGLDKRRAFSRALEAGADDFLAKPFSASQLLETLMACRSRMQSPVAGLQLTARARLVKSAPRDCPKLTVRQDELMELLSKGYLYKEIADRFGVSLSAVHGMQHRVFRKLHATNSREAIRKWHETRRGSGRG